MARPLRLVFPGAVYHVMVRGNDRQWVFEEPADWRALLALLETVVERYGWIVHAYCLTGNHYHLIIETPRGNLSIGMRHLNGCYARLFNRSRGRVGHVFQARFKSILVEKDAHLLDTIRYIALNPVATDPPLCSRPEEWPWGSYAAVLGLAPAPSWLNCDWTLGMFGPHYETARARLRAFVDSGLERRGHDPAGGIYFASDEFVRAKTADLTPIPEIPRSHWQPLRPTLEDIFASGNVPIFSAYRDYGYTMREIAEHVGCLHDDQPQAGSGRTRHAKGLDVITQDLTPALPLWSKSRKPASYPFRARREPPFPAIDPRAREA